MMGALISFLEARLHRWAERPSARLWAGVLLALTVVGTAYLAAMAAVTLAGRVHPWAGTAMSVWLISTTVSARGLADAARQVSGPLRRGDLAQARSALGLIVGRDTDALSESEVVRGTVETVAENTVDGVVAPIVFALLGGAPLAMAYRAVNTLDSMVGYRTPRHLELGRASARLDDVANYLPARVAGLLLVLAAWLRGMDAVGAVRTVLRDARVHPSPNGGVPEAAVAGALGVRLGGTNYYGGVPSARGHLGEAREPLAVKHIDESVVLLQWVTGMAVVAGLVLQAVWSG
jgi:adenosylcobinamide-phosphate synthase